MKNKHITDSERLIIEHCLKDLMSFSGIATETDSALTHWYMERYAGTKRSRRKGIVALARKLLIALWKHLEQDIVPEGAILKNE